MSKKKNKSSDVDEQTKAQEAIPEQVIENDVKTEQLDVSQIERESLQKQANDYKDKYLRTLAESENIRKRMQKEKQEILRKAREEVILDFLHPLDNFENAVNFSDTMSEEVKNWAIGFQMILSQFKEALCQNSVKAMATEGKLFDPHLHEAVETLETEEVPAGTIIKEFLKGYVIGDRTLRPAKVSGGCGPK